MMSFALPACTVSDRSIMMQSDHEGWILADIYLHIQIYIYIYLCAIYIYIDLFQVIYYNFQLLSLGLVQQILSTV